MSLNQNQFALEAVAGMLLSGSSLPAQYYSATATETVAAGTFVAISATTNGTVTKVAKGADTAADFFGMVLVKSLKSAYAVGDIVEVAQVGSVVTAIAGEAITAGARVMFDPATGKVMVKTTGKTIVGVALEDASTDGYIRIRVQSV